MATQIYKVRDPSGAIRKIEGPAGATDDQVIAKAKELFSLPETPVVAEQGTLSQIGSSLASLADTTIGGVLPMIGQAAQAVVRPFNTPQQAEQIGGNVSSALDKPFGKTFGVTEQPAYKQEASRQIIDFVGENVNKGADWLSSKTGLPVEDVRNILNTSLLAAPKVVSSSATLVRPIVNQLAPVVAPVTVPIKNAMVSAMQREPAAVMPGMGAAETSAAALRQERAQRFGVPLTKGEQMPGLGLQQFESDIVKQNPEIGKPLLELKTTQKKAIVDQFEKLAGETGAEFADPTAYKKVGSIVDQALINEFDKKFKNYKAKYQAADVAGETLQEVPYQGLVDYINKQTPTTRTSLAPILQDTLEQLKLNDPNGTGTISIRALEDVYQNIGKKAQPGTPNSTYGRDLKGLIDQTTEGAGGDLYRDARAARKQLATDFENNYRVAKLLGTKGGYADRAVALSDVFDHVVLDGSLEEMRTVTKLLKKGGPEGQQAYAELQGQTIQHLKDQMTKNASGELSFAKLKTAIDSLDREGKLEYMFGKTGRDTLLDLKSTVQDALVKDPRAVNWSNTGNVVLRGLDALAAIRFPGAKTAAEIAQNAALKKKVAESVNFNALAPSKASANALAP